MIAGVDHIALCSSGLDVDGEVLGRLGFVKRFESRQVPNAPGKASMLVRYAELHDISLHDGASGTAIELTAHGSCNAGPDFGYVPVVTLSADALLSLDFSAGPDLDAAIIEAAIGIAPRKASLSLDGPPLWVIEGEQTAVLGAVSSTDNFHADFVIYAEALGYRVKEKSSTDGLNWALLQSPGLMPQWRSWLLLRERSKGLQTAPSRLDDIGWTCLALLTTDLAKDFARLEAAGCGGDRFTFEVSVDGKNLAVGMLRLPGGKLVELIEIKR